MFYDRIIVISPYKGDCEVYRDYICSYENRAQKFQTTPTLLGNKSYKLGATAAANYAGLVSEPFHPVLSNTIKRAVASQYHSGSSS